jgi:hypothetical protein
MSQRANEMLGLKGDFWQRYAYNHSIRSRKEYRFQIRYVGESRKSEIEKLAMAMEKIDNI